MHTGRNVTLQMKKNNDKEPLKNYHTLSTYVQSNVRKQVICIFVVTSILPTFISIKCEVIRNPTNTLISVLVS